jgi:Flp pilus assembly protein TadG
MHQAPHFIPALRIASADRRGAAALEFAIVLPLLAGVLTAVVDLGGAIQQTQRLEAAARAGAQYAMTASTDQSGIASAVRGALPGWTDVTVQSTAMRCVCPGTGTVTCTSACAGRMQRYVTVAVTRPFDSLLSDGLTILRGDMTVRIR